MGNMFWQGAGNKKSDIRDVAFKIFINLKFDNSIFFNANKMAKTHKC